MLRILDRWLLYRLMVAKRLRIDVLVVAWPLILHSVCLAPQSWPLDCAICTNSNIGNTNAGNGRFCRNLLENAILNYAQRVYGSGDKKYDVELMLIEEDFNKPKVIQKVKPTVPIGFYV